MKSLGDIMDVLVSMVHQCVRMQCIDAYTFTCKNTRYYEIMSLSQETPTNCPVRMESTVAVLHGTPPMLGNHSSERSRPWV